MRRFDHYARTQKWIWRKAKELQERHDLGDAIDIIADALTLYEEQLGEEARRRDAEAHVQDRREQDDR